MMKHKQVRWFVGLIAAFASSATWAAEPYSVQDLFKIELDLKPSRALQLPVTQVKGSIPVKVLTDGTNRLVGIQLDTAIFDGLHTDGSTRQYNSKWAIGSMESVRSRTFELKAKVPGVGSKSIFSIDGTKLDPDTGGTVRIKYVSSLLGTHEVELSVIRMDDVWVVASSPANAKKGAFIKSAKIETNAMGLGFTSPSYANIDLGAIFQALSPNATASSAVADQMMKNTDNLINGMEQDPMQVGPVQINITSQKAS